jgi:lipopolysaccharide transport protein LptA
MTEVEMVYTKKEIFVVAVTVLCSVMANLSFADATADSIMFRRKPAASAVSKQIVQKTVVQPVAVETVEIPKTEEKPAEPAKVADVSVVKEAAEKPVPESEKPVAEGEKPATESEKPEVEAEEKKVEKKEKKEKKGPPRDAIITADRTDYDRKEGVVLFDRNVYVNDEQYQMHTDRLFLFLDGTNDLKRLVAIGNVAITNENRRAYCARATFNKKLGRIVMYSSDEITASLREEGKKGSEVKGEKITFWIDSEQVEVENPVITMPGGFGGGGKDDLKKALGR